MASAAWPEVLIIEDLGQQHLPARRLAAVLERAGLSTQLVDLNQGIEEIVTLSERLRPRLIAGSILFADRVPEYLALMTALRRSDVRAHLTLCGPLPALAPAELLAACPALDSVICGEAEATIVPLALHVQDGWQSLDGIASRFNTAVPQVLSDLDALPFPVHPETIPALRGYGFATVESSRGCYNNCTFCLPCAYYRQHGMPYRVRSIRNLGEELDSLYRQGVHLFLFDDEQFLPPLRLRNARVAALADELARRGLKIAFTIKCRADEVEPALFKQLQELGLLRVYIGIESGCPSSLDLFGKRTTVKQNTLALQILDELGLVADFRLLMFHPWSTLATVEADLDFAESMLPSISTLLDFREVEVYQGTPLAERLKAEGRGTGAPWCPDYEIADPGAELLRRLNRLLLHPPGAYARLQAQITENWFDYLLQERFETADPDQARRLKDQVRRVNTTVLSVYREQPAFARTGDIYEAAQVNARAADWVRRINELCMEVTE